MAEIFEKKCFSSLLNSPDMYDALGLPIYAQPQ